MSTTYMLELTDEELAALNALLTFELYSPNVNASDAAMEANRAIFEKVQRLMEGR